MIEAVLFDIDKTLVDFNASDKRALMRTIAEAVCDRLRSLGHTPRPIDGYIRRVAFRFIRAYLWSRLIRREVPVYRQLNRLHRRMGIDLPTKETENLYTACYESLSTFATPYPDAADTLVRLGALGVKLGAVSNTIIPGAGVDLYLGGIGLTEHLPVRVYSSETRYMKPDRRIFDIALREIGTPASATLFVGDRLLNDVWGARRAGMQTALVLNGRSRPMLWVKPDHVVCTLPELVPIVEAARS